MTLYKESFRRLSRLGVTLLAVTLIATTAIEAQNCIWANEANAMIDSALLFDPFLIVFLYLGGLAFAFAGFSFLAKRSDSDFYHSLPVSRTDLFLSVTLAALTWIVGTIFLSILSVTIVHLVTGRSFVPLYPVMNFLNYTAGTLLVFAAASIALSLTGTFFSAAMVTLVVLALPRFILFIIARTVAGEANGLINWLDFGVLLNPIYNAATAPATLLVRPILAYDYMSFGSGAYSLGLGVAETALACFLFRIRKSEIAEHGMKDLWLQTTFACLAALPLLLLVTSGRLSGTGAVENESLSATILVALVLSLAVFVAYQMIVLKSVKAMLKTLPFYAATVAVAFGIVAAASYYGNGVKNFIPVAEELSSVSFVPEGRNAEGNNTYRAMRIAEIEFADDAMLAYAAESYAETCFRLDEGTLYEYYYGGYNSDSVQVPVRFNLKSGRSEVRNVFFPSLAALENLRRQNAEYVTALASFAPDTSIVHCSGDGTAKLTASDVQALRVSYEAEFPKDALAKDPSAYALSVYPSSAYRRGDMGLVYGSFKIGGYIGTRRYLDAYMVVPEMEKTASLWMERCNARADAIDYAEMMQYLNKGLSDTADDWSYFNLNITLYNAKIEGLAGASAVMSLNTYGGRCDYTPEAQAIVIKTAKLIAKGKPSTDPTAVVAQTEYWAQFDRLENPDDAKSVDEAAYMSFDAQTEQELIKLFGEWNQLSLNPTKMYNYYD